MALWKPFRGKRTDLDVVEKHDGWIYFCTDDGSLFFDYTDADGVLKRKQLNAKEAESLLGYDISTILNSNDSEIPTSKAVLEAIDNKVPSKTSELTNDSGFITSSDIPESASASITLPKMNGTATVGTEMAFARGDHIHPKDTSKANLASPTFTGTPKAPTATAGTNTTQIATTAFVKTAIDSIETSSITLKTWTTADIQ